jgi:hypothetical protein
LHQDNFPILICQIICGLDDSHHDDSSFQTYASLREFQICSIFGSVYSPANNANITARLHELVSLSQECRCSTSRLPRIVCQCTVDCGSNEKDFTLRSGVTVVIKRSEAITLRLHFWIDAQNLNSLIALLEGCTVSAQAGAKLLQIALPAK